MQKFNYHGHTKRCGHAVGEDEEYVLQAIQNGYKKIGFSDHMPYPNGYIEGERMHVEELAEYVQSIKKLQEKYKDQIEIVIGLEFENYPSQQAWIKQQKQNFDYLIVGEHEVEVGAPNFYDNYSDEDTKLYGKMLVQAIEDELADIVAHPDLFMYGKEEWNKTCEQISHDICKAAQAHHIPLELNLNGLKYGKCKRGKEVRYLYPYRKFWEIAANYNVDVIFGLDAHTPEKYADKSCYEIVKNEIIQDIPLNILEDFDIKKKI